MVCKFCNNQTEAKRRDTYWYCPLCGCMVIEERFLESVELSPTIEEILIADEVSDKPVGFVEPNPEPKGFSVPQKNTTVLNSKFAEEVEDKAKKKAEIQKKIAEGKKAYIKKQIAKTKKTKDKE